MEQLIFFLVILLSAAVVGYVLLRRRQTVYLETITPQAIVAQIKQGRAISGTYRGHPLKVEVTSPSAKGGDTLSTRLTIEAGPPAVDQSRAAAMVNQFDIATELTQLLFPGGLTYKLKGELFITANGRKLIYDQPGLELNQMYLEFLLRTLTNLLEAYPTAIAMGGEAVPSLQFLHISPTHPLYAILPQLLRDIELDTTARIGSQPARYFCRRCLARCGVHKIVRPDHSRLKYYGCRQCHQSHDLFEGKVVLSLDNQMSTDQDVDQTGVLRLNWLSQRQLFDFHEVEIGPVDEAELQAFIDQIDHDPNLIHQHRYQQMRCVVAVEQNLPAHSLRRLRELFGQVEISAKAKPAHSGFRPGKNFSEKLW